ncbi:phosphoribosylformylglycinamidine synthase [Lutimonas zeaxanthinifaciens]|uniref:phosphoribosylformylglycinamidine synthase n=1 Tax=Lutimonas zeaxanthinifaciens TaxID=3060215 RepID=UPI00265CB50C|nr:phosphoribosylformylglycinamidine synthase [Lutimonas sp. YSD2104]WKK64844.1 phosphoribosylformylglycinamidine synthase [Lutimonas sp. YSD2104]
MIYFFNQKQNVFAVSSKEEIRKENLEKLTWLFGNAKELKTDSIKGNFVGPRKEMISPWSTNAVEITQNMGITGISRIEEFFSSESDKPDFDPMIQHHYKVLDQEIFTVDIEPEPVFEIEDIAVYNEKEGLALSGEEIDYLNGLSSKLGRKLTDSEIFGFSQVNSEHCRHKIFNGTFVIDGEEKPVSLFKMIKRTSTENPNTIVSAYKDNVAFIKGPVIEQFAPKSADKPDFYETKNVKSVISLKAETHNFPTTVEPFNGAATGSGGEIRDRLAGGKGSLPLAGTAVYMTPYSRLSKNRSWENMQEREWLYQTPIDLLIKASNGASDFGNKFGQPLISGSLYTFEHEEHNRKLGFDKVIMLAGGIGYGKEADSIKEKPVKGDSIILLGGDNYRIGMGGAAVSSADTGEFDSAITLNAVQRSNPEMQKRVANTIRGMVEGEENKIISIHDHGAGGHLNCLSELVEETGGLIDLDALPVGDKTLSSKEIIGNESQERMGLVIHEKDLDLLHKIADRERSPIYDVGEVTDDFRFTFSSKKTGEKPMDFDLADMFGSSPHTIMNDRTVERKYGPVEYQASEIYEDTKKLLQLEAVACKDWLTNKVDRCVGGKVAKQQCAGSLQIPLNDVGVMALDYKGKNGIATSIGHSVASALIDEKAGSKNAIAESLTNIVWAPLKEGLKSVSLSANWMWPCRNEGEDARLYNAVQAVSDFSIALGINVPTGKDSLSMKQKYPNEEVIAPGTVIISAAGEVNDIRKVVEPVFQIADKNKIIYIDFSKDDCHLGGSSFAQIRNSVGATTPDIKDPAYFKNCFNTVQELIKNDLVLAGHDISSGGLITTLLEMCFAENELGAQIDLGSLKENDCMRLLFSEKSGVVLQIDDLQKAEELLNSNKVDYHIIGSALRSGNLEISNFDLSFNIEEYRDYWYTTSYLLDKEQTADGLAKERFNNYKKQPLTYVFPEDFSGKLPAIKNTGNRPKAAIIREKGSNSEREMANAMYLAGFDVKDVHMTDLISGRETLEDIQFIGAVGGFSNSDVLGSAKGWAGAFLYNERANKTLKKFFDREDTLSVGICNGCQLFVELEMINPDHKEKPKMLHNESFKHECSFTSVKIQPNNSVMLSGFEGLTLGVWISHGEGKFSFPYEESKYNIVAKYGYEGYPANPNGSDFNTAMMASDDGRHLVMMPHIERSIFQWNWANYPSGRKDEVSPWLEAFVNARKWIENHQD